MKLHNIYSRQELLQKRSQESFSRIACSFYRYIAIDDPQRFRDALYRSWFELGILGRIYVSVEGINAQLCVPDFRWDDFTQTLDQWDITKDIFINQALSEGDASFLKLDIKVRHKIVSDGLAENIFEVSQKANHLDPLAFHAMIEQNEDVLVVDARNDYECEIGHFENALLPQSETFREVLPELLDRLKDQKDKKILMYCTGGIRCEKASAYLKRQGFKDVFQLQGGIINYQRTIEKEETPSKFHGSNFVFDGRMAEPIDKKVQGSCITCKKPYYKHVDCANQACHKLVVQCESCAKTFRECCSKTCYDAIDLNS